MTYQIALPLDMLAPTGDRFQANPNRGRIMRHHSVFDMLPGGERRRDGRWWTHCPFHDDTTGRMTIDWSGHACVCHDGCTPPHGYTSIELYAVLNRLSYAAAFEQLLAAAEAQP